MLLEKPTCNFRVDLIVTSEGAGEGETEGRRQLSNLLDSCFKLPHGCHFFDDFPIWDPFFINESVVRIGAYAQSHLIASVGIRLAHLKLPSSHSSLKIAIIGMVATLPKYRSQGLASRLVTLATEIAQTKGAAILFLWGTEPIYQKLGFEFCGKQHRIRLDQLRSLEQLTTLNQSQKFGISPGWNSEIFKLAQIRKDGLILASSDEQWYEAHKNVSWYTCKDISNKVIAYAGIGRGIDLKNIVHEWGGDKNAILKILYQIKKEYPDSEILGGSEQLMEIELLSVPPANETIESLCLAKVLAKDLAMKRSSDYPLAQAVFDSTVPFWVWGLDAC